MLQRLWHVAGEACSHHCDGRQGWQLRCCREEEADIFEWSQISFAALSYLVLSSWVIREACFEKSGCDGTNLLWLLLSLQGWSLTAGKHSHHEKGECRGHTTWVWGRGADSCNRDWEWDCPTKLKHSTAWKCMTTRWTGKSCQQQEWQEEVGLFDLALGYQQTEGNISKC